MPHTNDESDPFMEWMESIIQRREEAEAHIQELEVELKKCREMPRLRWWMPR
jgi:hypothetical protein